MVIDADGLFNGRRWRNCSTVARLHAPYLLVASNTFARLEVDPVRIIARVYATFQERPTEGEILAWVKEYADASLMFLYEHDGQLWGQWDVPKRLLASYQPNVDKRSPPPPEPAFSEWLQRYRDDKQGVSSLPKSLPKPSEKVPENFSETFPLGRGIGIGKGRGKGTGENIRASDDAHVGDSDFTLSPPKAKQPDPREAWFDLFWSKYRMWRTDDKKRGKKKFMELVTNETILNEVLAGFEDQNAEMLSRDRSVRPYAKSWLHGECWKRDGGEVAPTTGPAPPTRQSASIADLMDGVFDKEKKCP